jgi:hypothetical protein
MGRPNPKKDKAVRKAYHAAHKAERNAYTRAYRLRTLYGISQEQYDEMVARQHGLCALCGHAPTKNALAVDHDHDTGAVRGLLCLQCNTALGKLGDNADAIRRVLDYMERE